MKGDIEFVDAMPACDPKVAPEGDVEENLLRVCAVLHQVLILTMKDVLRGRTVIGESYVKVFVSVLKKELEP